MSNQLKIGWGKRSIVPDAPVPIPGQFYMRVSLGSFTPVLANALVMENGDDAVIFVSCDAVIISSEVLEQVRESLTAELPGFPAEKIILNATHTHAGPGDCDLDPYPHSIEVMKGEEVRRFISRQIADAVKDAWQNRAPGAISYGYGFAVTGHSRRVLYSDDFGLRNKGVPGLAVNGRGVMYGETNDGNFESYEAGTDAFINLLYTFDLNGKLTGAVINVPCPSQTSEEAWMLHASFWHNVREKLAAEYGDIGIIGQAAAAGDLSPRQLHYREAERRRYRLKYRSKIEEYLKSPMLYPDSENWTPEERRREVEKDVIEFMRAEDIANRITDAFDEVLSWAGEERFTAPVLKHEVRCVELSRRMFPAEIAEEEKVNYERFMQEEYITGGNKWDILHKNSLLYTKRLRSGRVIARYGIQDEKPTVPCCIHAVQIGDIAFATNRFELYMDYQHRIQARSPFEQTFIVQLVTDPGNTGSYLATERGEMNKGYSATPYCNEVSPEGGQQLVNATLEILEEMKK